MLKPSAMAAPRNRGAVAEVEEQQPCGAAAPAAVPAHRAKRPQQLQATVHDVAEQLEWLLGLAARVAVSSCSAAATAATAAAVVPTHRAKRPRLWQLAATSARRSRRDKPTLEVGRRVRATFEIGRKPVWFFGAVLATASADGSLLVGFDDGKHEHMRADRLTIVDDDGEV